LSIVKAVVKDRIFHRVSKLNGTNVDTTKK
jgi:hypothetical protein